MPVGKRLVSVIEIGTIPSNLVMVKPGGSKFSLETFAEAAFGLGIDVDAFYDVHVNSWSVLIFERFGRLKAFCCGSGDWRDCGRLAAAFGRAGWNSELFSASSQCGLVARFNLRR